MGDTLEVTAGELGISELLSEIQEGTRVIVRTEFLGSEHEVALRHDGDIYYCDTPTRLHKHETEEEMATCLRRQGYGTDE